MKQSHRRAFVKSAGAALASSVVAGSVFAQAAPKSGGWKKAFMLGQSSGPILPTFEMLREAGFEGVELVSPNKLDQAEILRARDKTGLVIHGVSGSQHWKDPLSSPDPAAVERGLAAIRKEFDDCKAYGGTTVLLVPAVVNKQVSNREAYERSRQHVRDLIPVAEKHGIVLAIEEVWNKFLLTPTEFVRYIDEFQSPWVKAYFDVGNIVEYGFPEEWIRELGPRIAKIHIKEYGKKNRFEYGLGEGDIDWVAVREALHSVGYDGWITAEVGLGDLAAMKEVVRRMEKLLGS